MSDAEKRMIDLEKHVAFQDHTLEELNEVIVEHQKTIDALQAELKTLKEQIAQQGFMRAPEEEELPPHY